MLSSAFNVFMVLPKRTDLILTMVRREISDRYAGQIFGALWAIGHPVFMTGLYLFVFGVIFKQRVGGTFEMPLDYTAYLLAGLSCWLSVQDGLQKSCSIITSNAALVKQTVFPLEVLPIKSMIVSLVPQIVSLSILTTYVAIKYGSLHTTYLLLPLLIAVQFIGMVGIAFLLSILGAYLRDLKDIIQLAASAGIYLTPIFYLPNLVPAVFEPLLYANPYSYLVWCYQDILYYGRFEHPWAWLVTICFNLFMFCLGATFFAKVKPLLGNIL